MGSVGAKPSLLLISLFLISVAPSWAQAPERFLTYESPDFNINIQYPSDWKKSEENLNRYQVVAFSAPEIEQSQTSLSSIVFTPAKLLGLWYDAEPAQPKEVDDKVRQSIDRSDGVIIIFSPAIK